MAELGDPQQPTVVLVHGYPDSKEVWSEVAARLAGRFHVVLYDVRGHGRSTAPRPLRGGFTLAKLTDDFLAVVDAVSPDRPVHLVGHDWGSVQSWEFVTVARTEGRIASLHLDLRAVPRPLRALGQRAREASDAPPGGPAPRPGRQVLVRVPAAHAAPAGTGLARPARQALAEDPGAGRAGPRRCLSDRLAARRRGARRLAVPGQRPRPAAQAAPGRVRTRARAAHPARGRRVPSPSGSTTTWSSGCRS
ncbi:alpha/beta fold hydrolase [Streptomyces tricolor]|nr:alpha/beta fold hydrolase [Streptomyces tricolor]